jgi:hypothetical protein
MGMSQAVYTVADFVYYWRLYVDHIEPFPGLADIFYLGRLRFMVAGLALMVCQRSGRDRVVSFDRVRRFTCCRREPRAPTWETVHMGAQLLGLA